MCDVILDLNMPKSQTSHHHGISNENRMRHFWQLCEKVLQHENRMNAVTDTHPYKHGLIRLICSVCVGRADFLPNWLLLKATKTQLTIAHTPRIPPAHQKPDSKLCRPFSECYAVLCGFACTSNLISFMLISTRL